MSIGNAINCHSQTVPESYEGYSLNAISQAEKILRQQHGWEIEAVAKILLPEDTPHIALNTLRLFEKECYKGRTPVNRRLYALLTGLPAIYGFASIQEMVSNALGSVIRKRREHIIKSAADLANEVGLPLADLLAFEETGKTVDGGALPQDIIMRMPEVLGLPSVAELFKKNMLMCYQVNRRTQPNTGRT